MIGGWRKSIPHPLLYIYFYLYLVKGVTGVYNIGKMVILLKESSVTVNKDEQNLQ